MNYKNRRSLEQTKQWHLNQRQVRNPAAQVWLGRTSGVLAWKCESTIAIWWTTRRSLNRLSHMLMISPICCFCLRPQSNAASLYRANQARKCQNSHDKGSLKHIYTERGGGEGQRGGKKEKKRTSVCLKIERNWDKKGGDEEKKRNRKEKAKSRKVLSKEKEMK